MGGHALGVEGGEGVVGGLAQAVSMSRLRMVLLLARLQHLHLLRRRETALKMQVLQVLQRGRGGGREWQRERT